MIYPKNIFIYLKRHPIKFLNRSLISYGFFWTLVESYSYFFENTKITGVICYSALILLSLLSGLILSQQKKSLEIKISHSNTTINIYFGDIFNQTAFLAIPVNEYFDSEIGLPVSANSLHGMVINRFFGGYNQAFDFEIEQSLIGLPSSTVPRTSGKSKRYEIGTCAKIVANGKDFILFSLCRTNLNTYKAEAGLQELVKAISGLCETARTRLNGSKLAIPLVGSGLAGIGLPCQDLLQIIILILIDESKKRHVCNEIDVVIHPDKFSKIDLSVVAPFVVDN